MKNTKRRKAAPSKQAGSLAASQLPSRNVTTPALTEYDEDDNPARKLSARSIEEAEQSLYSNKAEYKDADLVSTVNYLFSQMVPQRMRRAQILADISGRARAQYGWSGYEQFTPASSTLGGKQPFNMLDVAHTIYMNSTCPPHPRCTVSVDGTTASKPAVQFTEIANAVAVRSGIENVVKRAVSDAYISIGCVQVSLCGDNKVRYSVIDLDDLILDVRADTLDSQRLVGNRYRVYLSEVIGSGLFDKEAIEAMQKNADNQSASDVGPARNAMTPFTPVSGPTAAFDPLCYLVDVWCKYDGKVRTFLANSSGLIPGLEPIRETRSLPICPYRFLAFKCLPKTVFPIGPVEAWMPLNSAMNSIVSKTMRQALAQKDMLVAQGMDPNDQNRIMRANNMDWITATGGKDSVWKLSVGGAEPANVAIIGTFQQMFNTLSGNINLQGGLDENEGTLGQTELLAAQATKQASAYARTVMEFVGDLYKATMAVMWDDQDPESVYTVTKQVSYFPGLSSTLALTLDYRQSHPWESLTIDVNPESMNVLSPQQKVQQVMTVVQQIIGPMMPQIQAEGKRFDIDAFLSYIGKQLGMPELDTMIVAAPQNAMGGNSLPGTVQPSGTPVKNSNPFPSGGKGGKYEHKMSYNPKSNPAKDAVKLLNQGKKED